MASASDSQTNPNLLDAVRDLRNEKAWAAFQQRYEGLIRASCLKRGLREEAADELTQVVFAKLVEEMPSFVYDQSGSFRSWLRTLVRSAVIDHQRREKRHPGDQGTGDSAMNGALANLPDPHATSPDAIAEDVEVQLDRDRRLGEACDRIRARVGEQTWQAFWLKTVEGQPGAQVARQLRMSAGAVYQAGHRVRSMIEMQLGVIQG